MKLLLWKMTQTGWREKICELYEDYDALRRMSDKGKKFIEKYFTLQVAEDVLKADMNV